MLDFGKELLLDPSLGEGEKAYVRLFGLPILGMRIRARYLLPLLAEVLKKNPSSKIVDAGTGRGLFAMWASRFFVKSEVLGIDIDVDRIKKNQAMAQKFKRQNLTFELCDVFKLEEKGPFDVIFSTDNLEHVNEDQKLCEVFYKSLTPDGVLLVHVPHLTRNVFGWRRENFMGIEGHVRPGYTREQLSEMLKQAGFTIELVAYSYNSMETLANDISYLITGGREKRKAFYAILLPLLIFISWVGSFWEPKSDGSGLTVLARKGISDLESK